MNIYEELVARGLIAQVTDESEIRDLINNGGAKFYIGFDCTAAQWYDNKTLVSMHAEDDGRKFTSSVLEAYTLDGKRQTLTDKSIMASYPYAINGKIVFTDLEKGTAYMMTVK